MALGIRATTMLMIRAGQGKGSLEQGLAIWDPTDTVSKDSNTNCATGIIHLQRRNPAYWA